jgi:DNA-binding MarR family transcriptional regulator
VSSGRLPDATGVHEFFWFWYEWVRSPARRRQIDALTGLPESAWKILYKLRSSGPLSVTEIGRVVDLDKSTVSRHLEPLRAAGLIVETPGTHNRRVSEVSVSPRGAALCDRVDDAHVQYWSDVLAHLPEAERHDLARLLRQLQLAMEQGPELRVSDEAAS